MTEPLLEATGLVKHFPLRRGRVVRAVDGIDLSIAPGETLGLVGESGSGKSTAGRALLRLIEPTAGRVRFEGSDVSALKGGELRRMRLRMQPIFQDPYASLNPRMTAGAAVLEPLRVNRIGTAAEREARVAELFELVGLSAKLRSRYPHEFSGGQRQRIGIARALATQPRFVVADEAIASLDVSVQAQVVNLLQDLGEQLGLTYLFISHDLAMVRHVSDRIAVMYLGRLCELGPAQAVAERPLHPYTAALLSAVPVPDPVHETRRERIVLTGDVPDPADPPRGCRFHTRCRFATDLCRTEEPEMRDLGAAGTPHHVACHRAEELAA